MTADILALLVRTNLAAAVAVLVVLALRRPIRRRFGARLAYGLWLLPVLAVLASLPTTPPGQGWTAPLVVVAAAPWTLQAPSPTGLPLSTILASLWVAGAGMCAFLLALSQARFRRALGRLVPMPSAGPGVFRAESADAGPAVVGAAIVVPAGFEARFTAEEQAAILAHERAHLARGDVLANTLAAAAQCLCWFNPLVHLAAFQARVDQELACDATVLEGQPRLRRSYGEALLKTQIAVHVPPLGCTWPSRAPNPLKERIAMLKSEPPTAVRRRTGLILVAALAVGGGLAARAAQPAPAEVTQPAWEQRPTADDLARFYPADAVKQELQGSASMRCEVEVAGTLSGCTILRQAPEGAGFGEASLQMAPLFRMKPMSRDGRPVAGGVITIPIRFALALAPAPPAPTQP